MKPIEHIRKSILGVTQGDLGSIAGTTQATVSRWEAGELEPDRDHMARIRREIVKRGHKWNDRWFFDVPRHPRSSEPERAA